MAFDKLPLERPPAPRQSNGRASRSSTSRWVILAAGVAIAGTLLAVWWMSRAQPPPVTPAPAPASEAARTPARPQRQPMELPPLPQSDAMLRELVATLSRHPLLARIVAQKAPVRAITLAIVQIGDGRVPITPLAALRTGQPVTIDGGSIGRVDVATYARWNTAVRALLQVNAADAARAYVNVKPLFDEAYRELGYPGGDFDDAIVRAIRMLASTPEPKSDPILLARPAYFEHDNAALRALPPVQKQFLLTGPEHRQQIQGWLRRFAATLDLKID